MPLLPEWLTPKRLRITLIVVACVAALPLAVVEENWRGKHDFEKYQREQEAKGEHFDVGWFLGPTPPDDKNFAKAPAFAPLFDYTINPVTLDRDYKDPAATALNITVDGVMHSTDAHPSDSGNWQTGRMRDLEAWQKYYRAALPKLALSKSPAEDVLAALAQYDGYLADLSAADATRPESRFPLKFDPSDWNINWYNALQRTEGVLAQRAVAELRLGRADDAFADVKLGFRLIGSIRNDPMLLSGLVRLGMMKTLMQPVWEGLASRRWTDGQLTQLEALLQKTDFLEDFAYTVRGERAYSALAWEAARTDPKMADSEADGLAWLLGSGVGNIVRITGKIMRAFPALTWQNELYQFRFTQEKILPLIDVKARRLDVGACKAVRDVGVGRNPYTALARLGLPIYSSIAMRYAETQTYIDEARIACEIERYRRAHGALPEKLENLGMADMPHDLIDGKPLRYLIMGADDYRLYSIGWNEMDDGGKIGRFPSGDGVNYNEGDWVWSLKPL